MRRMDQLALTLAVAAVACSPRVLIVVDPDPCADGGPPSCAPVGLLDGLIGYWPLDDGPGSVIARDVSGHRNDGTLYQLDPATAWVEGRAGAGINLVRGLVGTGPIARALEAPRIEDVTNDTARSFRAFAERTGSDLKALAACMRGPREKIAAEDLAQIAVPTLVATGSEDVIAGSGEELRRLIPGAQLLDIEGRDHMKAVGDARFKRGVLDFLTRRP